MVLDAVTPQTHVIFLCSPNNPTGNTLETDRIIGLLERFEGIVVVDEAYVDFSNSGSLCYLLDKYPRLIILQTFSKAFGLAGIRFGMAIAHEDIIAIFNKVKFPYNISKLTAPIVHKALDNVHLMEANVKSFAEQKKRIIEELGKLPTVRKARHPLAKTVKSRCDVENICQCIRVCCKIISISKTPVSYISQIGKFRRAPRSTVLVTVGGPRALSRVERDIQVVIITEVYTRKYDPYFYTTQLIQVEEGKYVEIRFSIWFPGAPCADEEYLEIRDGYNQSANLLGVFCGRNTSYFTLRSSGHNMWLRFSLQHRYWLEWSSSYEGKAIDETAPANLTTVAQTQFVLFNHPSSLWCPAEGGPAPHIVWRKNGAVMQNSTGVKFQLNFTEKERNANYSCEVDSNGLLQRKNISLVVEGCPEPCRCKVLKGNMRGFIRVDCERKQLRSIPQNVPRATVKLDLSKNQLKTLPPGVFNNMTWLHGLDLSYNQLEELPPEAFSHNPHLIELFLNNNKLKNLSSDQLPCRIYLFNNHTKRDLSNNQLNKLPPGVVSGIQTCPRSFIALDLSKNQLKTLPPGVFNNMTWLHGLDLSRNEIETLPPGVFKHLVRLFRLKLIKLVVDSGRFMLVVSLFTQDIW
ncbi:Histidinol-phosphate aminotransferase [Stylophora pistillata]|uniref:histidinol-phosphate transaminase n=1 Tax=Stylophora pistillata TaxID=50429 RepID=A0A2B4RJQ8_STYPI|nr:Histidinol-phosphate aminotransferase [Stylophora pistillata]